MRFSACLLHHRDSRESIIEYETQFNASSFIAIARGPHDGVKLARCTLAVPEHCARKELRCA